jgi:hypothetical protein
VRIGAQFGRQCPACHRALISFQPGSNALESGVALEGRTNSQDIPGPMVVRAPFTPGASFPPDLLITLVRGVTMEMG